MPGVRIRPDKNGKDIEKGHVTRTAGGEHGTVHAEWYDGHVRLERGRIHVDIFNSSIQNPSEAHVESESFGKGRLGARAATEFLHGYGFSHVTILPVEE